MGTKHVAGWDNQKIERLYELFDQQPRLTFEQIADKLGLTKSMVAGKLARLKLKRGRPKAAKPRRRNNYSPRQKHNFVVERATLPPPPDTPEPPELLRVAFDFAPGACKFIYGHPGGVWASCGGPVMKTGASWCAHHNAKIFQPQSVTTRQTRLLARFVIKASA